MMNSKAVDILNCLKITGSYLTCMDIETKDEINFKIDGLVVSQSFADWKFFLLIVCRSFLLTVHAYAMVLNNLNM